MISRTIEDPGITFLAHRTGQDFDLNRCDCQASWQLSGEVKPFSHYDISITINRILNCPWLPCQKWKYKEAISVRNARLGIQGRKGVEAFETLPRAPSERLRCLWWCPTCERYHQPPQPSQNANGSQEMAKSTKYEIRRRAYMLYILYILLLYIRTYTCGHAMYWFYE